MTKNLANVIVFAGLVTGLTASGQTWHTWTGADGGNNYWSDPQNWNNGAPGWLNAYTVFPDPAPAVNTCNMNGVWFNGLQKLLFNTVGYTITDTSALKTGGMRFDNIDETTADIVSLGVGINTVAAGFSVGSGTGTRVFSVASGNVLHFTGSFAAQALTVQGGGTMAISSPGADTARNFNANYTLGDANTTLLFNSIEAVNFNWTRGTLGGTGGLLTYGNGGTTAFSGGTWAPGGDGITAPQIGTFTVRAWDLGVTGNWNVDINSGATVAMQFGTDGTVDKVMLELTQLGTGNLAISSTGTTLALTGTTIPNGTYTLFENLHTTAANITGSFATVTYNGAPVNPTNFTLHYNSDSITVDVTGMAPSTGTVLVLR